jgi:hypothetical protein
MKGGAKVWHFFMPVDAVLSQNVIDHPHNLLQANPSAFNQARCQLNMKDDGYINTGFTAFDGFFIPM